MIVSSWRDVLGFCPARFGVLFCSAMSIHSLKLSYWEPLGVDTLLKLLGATRCRYTQATGTSSQWRPFLTVGVQECNIAHRRSDAVLCMLYKIGGNLMHPLYGAPLVQCATVGSLSVGRSAVYLLLLPLQKLAEQQEFYFLLGI